MNQKENKNRGMTLIEYGLILIIVVVAFFAMNIYMKRGIQGRIKDMTDVFISNEQKDSGDFAKRESETNVTTDATEIEETFAGGSRQIDSTITSKVSSNTTAYDEDTNFIGDYTPVDDSDAPTIEAQIDKG